MQLYFRKKNWSDVVGEKKGTSASKKDKSDECELCNAEAMEFIARKVSDRYLYLITSKKTAADMWKAIIDSFAKSLQKYWLC